MLMTINVCYTYFSFLPFRLNEYYLLFPYNSKFSVQPFFNHFRKRLLKIKTVELGIWLNTPARLNWLYAGLKVSSSELKGEWENSDSVYNAHFLYSFC